MALDQDGCGPFPEAGTPAGETRVDLTLPDVWGLDEAGLARWFPHLDGRWTDQTKALVQRFTASGLDLNWNWFETATDWQCTCCGRRKPEIVRLIEGGTLLAHLHVHHDHLREHLGGRLNERFGIPWAKNVPTAARNASDHMRALVLRFLDTMVCDGCNAAEGEAKKALGRDVHRHFSFTPSEISRFVRPRANALHEVDIETARAIWLDLRAGFEDRLAFVEVLVERLATGSFAVERNANSRPLVQPSALDDFLGRQFLKQSSVRELCSWRGRLWSDLSVRSLSRDGIGRSRRPQRLSRARTPTDVEYATFEEKPKRAWERTSSDWSCPGCGRGKRAILRLGGSGQWFGEIRIHEGVRLEGNAENLAYRRELYPEHLDAPVVSDRRQRFVCSDCGDVSSELRRARPDLGTPMLTLQDVRDCLGDIRDNEKTHIDLDRAAERAEGNFDLQRADWEFTVHRDISGDLWALRLRYGLAAKDELRAALTSFAHASGVAPDATPEALGWLLRQGKAFRNQTCGPD
ncbi:hypothetical protein [Methylobacterium marchantiae]|uniref:Uncharacterized protein n=1 Tax=Methylobacterium marchantiae TaxID=600331 RepID=A0ABW3X401_9HYPH|nr:hypothetical protein AIGOOFII_4251 [Methylobacterium marchantiae]